jgi:GNAT superfamily N-acetyltransferase
VIEVTTDTARVKLDKLAHWLNVAYWSEGRPLETIKRSVEQSLNFSAYVEGDFVGYARVVTDHATFAWLCDVVVEEDYRGRGVGKALIEAVVAHPDLNGIKRMLLATLDAHGLYEQYGFVQLPNPERWMVRANAGAR